MVDIIVYSLQLLSPLSNVYFIKFKIYLRLKILENNVIIYWGQIVQGGDTDNQIRFLCNVLFEESYFQNFI